MAASCGGREQRATPAEPKSIMVVAEPPAAGIVREAAADFIRLYPGNEIRVEEGSAREAMAALFGGRAQMAIVGREISDDERAAAQRARVVFEAQRWARDGLAIVVHPSNPVEQLAFDDLREIFAGTKVSWSDFGGPKRRIVPVVQDVRTGTSQFFADQVMAGTGFAGPAVVVEDDSAATARVASEPGAIGFVSLPFADRGVKALRIASVKGLPYVPVDARTVYEKRYPLIRFHNVVLRVPGQSVANDFTTFLCAQEGQRRVLEAGLVPATVPVRFTSRTPTLPSH